MPKNNEIMIPDTNSVLARVNISEQQRAVVANAAAQILNITSRAGELDSAIKKMATEVAADPRILALKQYKKNRRELKRMHSEAVAGFNGALKMALAEVPGNSLNEKYAALGVG